VFFLTSPPTVLEIGRLSCSGCLLSGSVGETTTWCLLFFRGPFRKGIFLGRITGVPSPEGSHSRVPNPSSHPQQSLPRFDTLFFEEPFPSVPYSPVHLLNFLVFFESFCQVTPPLVRFFPPFFIFPGGAAVERVGITATSQVPPSLCHLKR